MNKSFLIKNILAAILWITIAAGVAPNAWSVAYNVAAPGAIANTGADTDILFNGAYTATLTGTSYAANYTDITYVDFNGRAATLVINAGGSPGIGTSSLDLSNVTFTGDLAVAGTTAGTIEITSTGTITLGQFADGGGGVGYANATQSAGMIQNLILDANTNVTTAGDLIASQVTLGNNATLTIGSGHNVGISSYQIGLGFALPGNTNGDISGSESGYGNLTISEINTILLSSIGSQQPINQLTILSGTGGLGVPISTNSTIIGSGINIGFWSLSGVFDASSDIYLGSITLGANSILYNETATINGNVSMASGSTLVIFNQVGNVTQQNANTANTTVKFGGIYYTPPAAANIYTMTPGVALTGNIGTPSSNINLLTNITSTNSASLFGTNFLQYPNEPTANEYTIIYINGNVYTDRNVLTVTGTSMAQMFLVGGTSNIPHHVSGTTDADTTITGQDLAVINVGDGATNTYIDFDGTIGQNYPISHFIIVDSTTANTVANINAATTITNTNFSFLGSGFPSGGGLRVGNNGVLNVNDAAITLTGSATFVPTHNNNGTVVFNNVLNVTNGSGTNLPIGSSTLTFAQATLNNIGSYGSLATIANRIYSNNITASNSYINFIGPLGTSGVGNALTSLNLTGTSSNIFQSSATDIYTTNFNHTNVIYAPQAATTTIHGNYNMNNATLTLGANKLIVPTGDTATLTGNLVINATYDGSVGYYAIDMSNATINPSALSNITLNITSIGTAPAVGTNVTFIKTGTITGNPSVSQFNGKITPISTTNAIWAPSSTIAGAIQFNGFPVYSPPAPAPVQTAQEMILSNLSVQDSFFEELANNSNLSQKSVEILQSISTDPNALTKFETAATELSSPATATEVVNLALNGSITSVDERIFNQLQVFTPSFTPAITPNNAGGSEVGLAPTSQSTRTHSNLSADEDRAIAGENLEASAFNVLEPESYLEASGEGIAAGSSAYEKFGLWVSVIGARADQHQRKGFAGFRSNSKGGIAGVDTMINDSTIIGFAVSEISTHIKHKNNQTSDTAQAKSWVGTIYGNHAFRENWFVRGAAAATYNNIKGMEKRVIGSSNGVTQYGPAYSKYDMFSVGADLSVGYTYRMKSNISIIPSLGVRLAHVNKISYKETGNTGQNKSVSQKASTTASTMAGLQIAGSFNKNNLTFTPEIHTEVSYGLNPKSPSGKFSSEFTNNQGTTTFVGSKPSPFAGTIGAGVTVSSDRVECGMTYDVNLADKYVGQQISAKLKVKF